MKADAVKRRYLASSCPLLPIPLACMNLFISDVLHNTGQAVSTKEVITAIFLS